MTMIMRVALSLLNKTVQFFSLCLQALKVNHNISKKNLCYKPSCKKLEEYTGTDFKCQFDASDIISAYLYLRCMYYTAYKGSSWQYIVDLERFLLLTAHKT